MKKRNNLYSLKIRIAYMTPHVFQVTTRVPALRESRLFTSSGSHVSPHQLQESHLTTPAPGFTSLTTAPGVTSLYTSSRGRFSAPAPGVTSYGTSSRSHVSRHQLRESRLITPAPRVTSHHTNSRLR